MKKLSLIILGFFTISFVYCQQDEWLTYDIDTILSTDMPGDVFQMDTTMDGMKVFSIFSNQNNTHFIAQKTMIFKDNADKNLSPLPHDSASLEKFYNGAIEGASGGIMKKMKFKKRVMLGSFKGYHIQFVDSIDNPVQDIEFYLLNDYLYSFIYMSYPVFNSNERDRFFNSIKIQNSEGVSQFPGKDTAYKVGYAIGKYVFYITILLIIAVVIYFSSRKKKKQIN